MTRQTRTLLLLGILGLGAVVVLGWMAQRYQQILTQTGSGAAGQVAVTVARFIETRRQMHERAEEWKTGDALQFSTVRAEVQREVGIDAADYREARMHFRNWIAGRDVDPIWGQALDAQGESAHEANLGDFEARDL